MGHFQPSYCLTLVISPNLDRRLLHSHTIFPIVTESNKQNLCFWLTLANKQFHVHVWEKLFNMVSHVGKSVHTSCNPQLCSRALHSSSPVPFFFGTGAEQGDAAWICCQSSSPSWWELTDGCSEVFPKEGKNQESPHPLQVRCYCCIGKAMRLKEPGEANEAKRRVRFK